MGTQHVPTAELDSNWNGAACVIRWLRASDMSESLWARLMGRSGTMVEEDVDFDALHVAARD